MTRSIWNLIQLGTGREISEGRGLGRHAQVGTMVPAMRPLMHQRSEYAAWFNTMDDRAIFDPHHGKSSSCVRILFFQTLVLSQLSTQHWAYTTHLLNNVHCIKDGCSLSYRGCHNLFFFLPRRPCYRRDRSRRF